MDIYTILDNILLMGVILTPLCLGIWGVWQELSVDND